jgi:hypothetical protein
LKIASAARTFTEAGVPGSREHRPTFVPNDPLVVNKTDP